MITTNTYSNYICNTDIDDCSMNDYMNIRENNSFEIYLLIKVIQSYYDYINYVMLQQDSVLILTAKSINKTQVSLYTKLLHSIIMVTHNLELNHYNIFDKSDTVNDPYDILEVILKALQSTDINKPKIEKLLKSIINIVTNTADFDELLEKFFNNKF